MREEDMQHRDYTYEIIAVEALDVLYYIVILESLTLYIFYFWVFTSILS